MKAKKKHVYNFCFGNMGRHSFQNFVALHDVNGTNRSENILLLATLKL